MTCDEIYNELCKGNFEHAELLYNMKLSELSPQENNLLFSWIDAEN